MLGRPTPACLLVDDREENLFAYEALLRDTGARIFKARCADDALELLLAEEFAVALVDVQMPGMNGLELAETMRGTERTRGVPIIFVTAAQHDESLVFRGYDRGGAVDFLYKPIAPHVVRSKVRVFLELEERRRDLDVQLARTELALAEAEAAKRALFDATQLRERLLAIVSHDLRTPLAVIAMTVKKLARRGAAPELAGDLARIERSASRMARIIEELLDFSRAHKAGGFPVERQAGDLAELCRAVVAELQVVHPARPIALCCDERIEGTWDPRALSQALSNLVGNAIEHGAGPVSVVVRAGPPAHVEVHNGGEPIPPELLAELFEPYRRGPSRSPSRGLGLGLYIAREIIRAHGGTLDVASSRKDGTRFTAVLPVS